MLHGTKVISNTSVDIAVAKYSSYINQYVMVRLQPLYLLKQIPWISTPAKNLSSLVVHLKPLIQRPKLPYDPPHTWPTSLSAVS